MNTPKHGISRRRALVAATALLPSSWAIADASFPSRPIRIVVPMAAGTNIDLVTRMLGDRLARSLSQPVIVENRTGAGGMIGVTSVARGPADGYTLLMGADTFLSLMPHINRNVTYDPFKDFAPVSLTTKVPLYLVTTSDRPYDNLPRLIADARARPQAIKFGSHGNGSMTHVRMEYLNSAAGTQMLHVPYRTTYIPDLLSGTVDIAFAAGGVAFPLIRSGKLKALAITSAKRSPAMPDVPTIAEVLPGYDGDGWQGIFVPVGTPPAIIDRLNAEFVRILKDPELRHRLEELSMEPLSSSPQELHLLLKSEYSKWGKIAKDNNILVD